MIPGVTLILLNIIIMRFEFYQDFDFSLLTIPTFSKIYEHMKNVEKFLLKTETTNLEPRRQNSVKQVELKLISSQNRVGNKKSLNS